jgi:acyl-CoA hydrolase
MEVGVRVVAEDHRTRVERHVMSCFVVMVAMNEAGVKVEVPRFEPVDEMDRSRWQAAERRRAVRTTTTS